MAWDGSASSWSGLARLVSPMPLPSTPSELHFRSVSSFEKLTADGRAYKFQEIAAWIVFVIGLVNCLFGVFLFESIRQFRSLVPGDEPQPEFNSYSSTQGHSPPMRSMSLAKHGQDVERPQPALKEFGRSSSRNQAASANSNRRSFKGFGPRKATYHTNLGHGRNPSSPPSLGGGAASFAKQQHYRSASTGGRMFDGTAPRSFNSLREASRSASGPPGYTKHQDSHRAEILALDPATAPAIRYVRR